MQDEELRHVLFSFILKWFGGYPIEEKIISSYDGTVCRDKLYPVLELIQGEFLGYESTTPEKDYCLKEEERRKRISDDKAKRDAEIDREKYASSEPAPVATSTEIGNIPKKKKRVNSEAQNRHRRVMERYNIHNKNGHTEKMILDKLVYEFSNEYSVGDFKLNKENRRKQLQRIIRNSKEQ